MTTFGETPTPDEKSLLIQRIAEQRSALITAVTEYTHLRAQSYARHVGLESFGDVVRLALDKLLDEYDAENGNALADEASASLVIQAENEEEFLRKNPGLPRI
jgi:hypothetical protein